MNRGFIAPTNLIDILYNSSYIGVAAVGMTMIILCGHIDISIGAALGLCATVAGKLAVAGVPLWIVFTATILTGGVIGLTNGLLVAYCRIPAIVATLGMASILKGGLILSTGGIWIYGLPPGFGISRRLISGDSVADLRAGLVWRRFFDLAEILGCWTANLRRRRQCRGGSSLRNSGSQRDAGRFCPERPAGWHFSDPVRHELHGDPVERGSRF